MNELGCKYRRGKGDEVVGEHQRRSEVSGVLQAALVKKDRPHGYHLGPLEEVRRAFETFTTLTFKWDPDELAQITETTDGSECPF
jgi:hypothetical protein